MSSNYTYPGQGYVHTLTALKGWYSETALDAECRPSANVNIGSNGSPINSGTVVHAVSAEAAFDVYGGVINGPGTFVVEMGCGSDQGFPFFVWPGSNDPDISNPGVPPGTSAAGDSTYGPPDAISVLPDVGGGRMPCLVAKGAYELESTEADFTQTLAVNQYLRAVTSNTLANAGKMTTQNAATVDFNSGGLVVVGTDTVVGIISRGKYINANRKNAVAFYPHLSRGTR
jgi:hypothetical protein